MSKEEIAMTRIVAAETAENVRVCGLRLQKIDNRPENIGVAPELALARRIVLRDRVENGRVRVDTPTVTPDEAVELMAHHLALAAAYYEATPQQSTLTEMLRLIKKEPAREAARQWFIEIDSYYAELKRRQEGTDAG